jgi:hypothetical protein
MPAIIVLAGVGFLAISTAAIFTVIIIGIHKGDRRHLINAPQSNSDAFARRVLVGIRYPAAPARESEKPAPKRWPAK